MSNETVQPTYSAVIAAIDGLDEVSKRRVLTKLKKQISGDTLSIDQFITDLRDRRFRKGFACPHCSSEKVVRNGNQNGRQRYLCRGCSKSFSDHTCTPFRGTHYPDKWLTFMEHMISGYSIRKSAKILCVATKTIFTWRHKILSALSRMSAVEFEGLLEVDETYFLYSEKGNKHIADRKPRKRGGSAKRRGISREQVCAVVARDRQKTTHVQVACLGKISNDKAHTILDPHIRDVSTICSDANCTWRALAESHAIGHVELNGSRKERVKKRIYHIQNVNSFHGRLKSWIERFNGVASKFLNNYLVWFKFIDAHSREAMTAKKLELFLSACLPISPERYLEIHNTKFVLP